ncbi:glycosyltransferase family 2 protein [Endozoicomonas acroporae]|uniref:glycosyltransferase family 2 protein n=1 Tax=Endozoicomonas acroporae TaxID=1701104 RepID=UPI003D7BF737
MSNANPFFSIVIPVYNYAHSLARAVDSVLVQGGDDYEVLVVNDGSTDNTDMVLNALHQKYHDRFHSVSRSNHGLAATRNYGIDHTSGEWLIFLDSDDELAPDALATLRSTIKKSPKVRMVVGGHISVAEDGSSCYRGVKAAKNNGSTPEELFIGYLLKKTVSPSNGATAMHREIFNRVRYPEEFRNSEDIPVFAYAFASFPCAFVDKPVNRIYKHDDSLRHNTAYAHAIGTQLVDAVFNDSVISEQLLKYRKSFAAQRCLSLFRTLQMAGEIDDALYYYREAIKNDWQVMFKLSYTRKALRCLIGKKGR